MSKISGTLILTRQRNLVGLPPLANTDVVHLKLCNNNTTAFDSGQALLYLSVDHTIQVTSYDFKNSLRYTETREIEVYHHQN